MNRFPDPGAQLAFVTRVLGALERLNIRYAIGGSVAAMEYSAPRLTNDVDVMLLADAQALSNLVNEVTSWGMYIAPLEAILEQDIAHGLPFNIVDGHTGSKADVYVIQPIGLPASAMGRRRQIIEGRTGLTAWFLSPEDVILYNWNIFAGVKASHKNIQ